MNTIKYLSSMFAVAALAAVACADGPNEIQLAFAPGDTLAYSHDGCEPVKIDLDDQPSPVTLELGRDGHYAFSSNGVMTATRDVSGLGTTVTEPNWAANAVTFTLDTLAERTFDLADGVATTNLTYSGTGWDEPGTGMSATITCEVGGQETTLASGLVGMGKKTWTPPANGTYTLTHTSGTATETATITVANLPTVTIAVGDLAAKHLTGKVVWDGTETEVAGQSFELPKGGKDAKLVLTAKGGYVLPPDQTSEMSLDDHLAKGESVSIADAIPAATEYGVRLLGVTNRYPWNGKIDVVASVAGLDAESYYSLVTTLTLGGMTKRISIELGAGKDATYTNTVDCAALFGTNAVGEVSVKLSLEQYAAERAGGVMSVAKPVDLTTGEYLIINLDNGTSVEATLRKYLDETDSNAWTLKDGWTADYKTKYLVMRKVKAGVAYPCDPGSSGQITKTMTPTNDYWIGVHQVTAAQYDRVVNAGGSTSTDAKPKYRISWNTIRGSKGILEPPEGFMSALSKKTNLAGFDLPTEAQWEIAARAGSAEEYGAYVDESGYAVKGTADNIGDFAIYIGNYEKLSPETVGQLRPNLWGLYDTAGNICEWCRDGWGSFNRQDVETPASDLPSYRVNRGGSFFEDTDICSPSYRNIIWVDCDDVDTGFRLSRICE